MPHADHQQRYLDPGEPTDPTEAWLEYPDGRRVDLTLERTGPNEWTASAPEPVYVNEGVHLRLDRLGPGQGVEFQNVYSPPSEGAPAT